MGERVGLQDATECMETARLSGRFVVFFFFVNFFIGTRRLLWARERSILYAPIREADGQRSSHDLSLRPSGGAHPRGRGAHGRVKVLDPLEYFVSGNFLTTPDPHPDPLHYNPNIKSINFNFFRVTV